MTVEAVLGELEGLAEPVVLVPVLIERSRGFPLTATEVLQRYRRRGKRALTAEMPSMPEGKRLYLEPWGWLAVMRARVVEVTPERGGTFETGRAVAEAIARADDILKPVPLGKRWLLAHTYRSDLPPTLVTAAFWLRTRQQCFLAAVADYVQDQGREPPIPLVVMRNLAAPAGEIIQ